MRWGSEEAVRAVRLARGGPRWDVPQDVSRWGRGGAGMGWGGGGDLLNHLFHRRETKTKAKMSCFSSKTLLIRSCPHHHTDIFILPVT